MADVAALLQPNSKISVEVMGKDGVLQDRVVMPRAFDPSKPNSLLGCQITDICPARFAPHPAMRDVARKKKDEERRRKQQRDEEEEEARRRSQSTRSAPAMSSREFLHQLPSWHDEDGGPKGRDDGEQELDAAEEEDGWSGDGGWDDYAEEDLEAYANEKSAPHGGGGLGNGSMEDVQIASGPQESRWRSRCVLVVASLLNLGHGGAFLAAPSFGSETGSLINTFRQDLWRLATAACDADTRRVLQHEHPHVMRAMSEDEGELDLMFTDGGVYVDDNEEDDDEFEGGEDDDVVGGSTSSSSSMSSSTSFDEPHLSFGGFVRVAMVATGLELLLAACGVALALLPLPEKRDPSSLAATMHVPRCFHDVRRVLAAFYPPAALLLWLLLAAMATYCLAYRWDANELLRRYWECLDVSDAASLQDEEGEEGGAATSSNQRYFESVDVVAMVCASADLSAVLGLFAACALIGWRKVLGAGMVAFGGLGVVGGFLLTWSGVVLHGSHGQTLAFAPGALSNLGGAMTALGLLGAAAGTTERDLLLKLHAALLAIVALIAAAASAALLSAGAGGAHAAKQPMLERVLGGQDVDATLDLVQANKTSLSIASVLGLFLLAINGAMTMGLRSAVHGQGRGGGAGGGGSYQRVEMIRS